MFLFEFSKFSKFAKLVHCNSIGGVMVSLKRAHLEWGTSWARVKVWSN